MRAFFVTAKAQAWLGVAGEPKIDTTISVHFLCSFHIEIGNAYLPRPLHGEHPERLTDDRKVLDFTPVTVAKDHHLWLLSCLQIVVLTVAPPIAVVRVTAALLGAARLRASAVQPVRTDRPLDMQRAMSFAQQLGNTGL
jgi:hypothetical protein